MLVEEYADKVERFIYLWREQMITDDELVQAINALGGQVTITSNGVVVSSKPRN